MSHETECFGTQNIHYSTSDCPICSILRAAYKRGREDAAKAIHSFVYHPQEEMMGKLMTIKMAIDTARGEETDDDCTFEDCTRVSVARGGEQE